MESEVFLYQPGRVWGMPNASPFCAKVEFYLKAAKIPYKLKPFDPSKSPRGKMPFIKLDEEFIPDSEMIIDRLDKKYNVDFDAHLSEEQKHLAHTIRRMLEEASYFIVLWNRWVNEKNWPKIRDDYFSFMPPVVKKVLPNFLRKGVKRTCHGHGVSRYSKEELQTSLQKDIDAVMHFMSDEGPFYFGDKISKLDLTVFPYLQALKKGQEPDPFQLNIKNRDKYERYVTNIETQFFN